MKWVSVVTAPNQIIAELWCSHLQSEGIPAMVKAGDVSSFLGVTPSPCQVLVPDGREIDAWNILDTDGSFEDSADVEDEESLDSEEG